MEEIEAHQLHHLSLHLLGYQLDTKDDLVLPGKRQCGFYVSASQKCL